ncbi:helix-turn-helix transcriptional regulator [Pleionea mediterranea]|nr:LuxR C-terminal-related transcriptional regulator [Pleionea mediterranea]
MTLAFNSTEQQARYQRASTKQMIILVSMALLVIGLISIVFIAYRFPSVFPQDQHFVLLPLILFWLFLFRRTPAMVYALRRDAKQSRVASVEGLALLHNKPGFRIVFLPTQQLSVDGHSFDLNDYPQEKCYVGRNVTLHYLPHSKLLLSVMPLQKQNTNDGSADSQSRMVSKQGAISNNTTASKQTTATDLTELEISIVQLMAGGDSDKIIARKLNLEPATIRTYNSTLYRKLGVNARKQAADKAGDLGLLDVN